jgi:BSD domain
VELTIHSTSRVEALLHDLHSNPALLLTDPDISQEPSFSSWKTTFSAENVTDEIAALLDRYPELRSQMDSIVPEKTSYKDFWLRYLYQKSKIDADETKRKQLFERSKVEENDFDWDGDDEADETQQTEFHVVKSAFPNEGKISTDTVIPAMSTSDKPAEENPRNSSTSESSTSFDIVSQSSAVPPMTKDKVRTQFLLCS